MDYNSDNDRLRGEIMHRIDINEFKKNVDYYIDLCSKGEIRIEKDGKPICVLMSYDDQYYRALSSLCSLPKVDLGDKDYKDIIGEEILKKTLG